MRIRLEPPPEGPEPGRPPEGPDPAPDPDPTPAGSLELRSFVGDAVVRCVEKGQPVPFRVEIRNATGSTVTGIAIHDSLTSTGVFQRPLTEADVEIDRARTGPSRGSTRSPCRPPSPAPSGATRVVGRGADGSPFDEDTACIATTLAGYVDVDQDDGVLDAAGAFDPGPEEFHVGDGGEARPTALVYRLRVENAGCTVESVRVVDELDPGAVLGFRGALPGSPSRGAIVASGDVGFTWEVGGLGPGETAEILFRTEARAPGSAVNRARVRWVEGATLDLIDEESTRVVP